ncbi:hypothetical protein AOQ84DRAFT_223796 [Glonium stellatum]|uniref:Uncharacterized protein n=1 Tax=Glonium stellatum TaxID=574774 RepID=A0A8E2EXQ4_9PEZI|nr:hypothetical protein AOQ84DRAFT_223796 [Glonium stellatum]
MFQHEWHFFILFNNIPGTIPAHIMVYLLSSSLWETNYRYLDADIKRLSFNDIRHPNFEINGKLHDWREDLEQLKKYIPETLAYAFSNISAFFEKLPVCEKRPVIMSHAPIQNLENILKDTRELESFLIDTFQSLASSISVEQAQRATLLTQLAFIYVPFSFVTGVFGMKLKEINGSLLSAWACIVSMAIVILFTLGIFSLIKAYIGWNRGQKQERQHEEV